MRTLSLLLGLATAACILPSDPELGGMPIHDVTVPPSVTLTARAEASQDTVYAWVTFTNSGTSTVEVEFGACSFAVRVAGIGNTWDNRLPANAGCPDVGIVATVFAGVSVDWMVLRRPISEIRPTGNPRPYRVRVYYRDRAHGQLHELDAGTVAF